MTRPDIDIQQAIDACTQTVADNAALADATVRGADWLARNKRKKGAGPSTFKPAPLVLPHEGDEAGTKPES